MIKYCLSLFFLLFSSYFTLVQAQSFRNEFSLRSENDSYLGQGHDRYYTNGLFLTYRHAFKPSTLKPSLLKKTWEIEVGQYMFNPQAGRIEEIYYIDRPFSGYLYGGGKMNWFFKNNGVLSASAQIGTIGPNSLARQGQELLHKIIGFYKIEGWEFQTKNELGLNTAVDYTRLLTKTDKKVDVSFNGVVKAGTTFSGASVGFLFRAGKINALHNSASTNGRITSDSNDSPGAEFFFFAKPQLQIIAYDATIKGGLFRKDKGPATFNPKPVVFTPSFGAAYASNRWTIDFAVVLESRRTKVQVHRHQYGSLGLNYRFN